VVKKAAHGGAAVRIRRECLDCSLTEPLCGFAPVFNLTPDARGETLILVCNACGERANNNTLTELEVVLMRKMHASKKYTIGQLADIFGCHRVNVSRVVHRVTWSHVT
jgi:hypothetical protein